MRRISVLMFVMSVAILAMATSVAIAAAPHFKGKSGPTAVDQGTTLNVTGTLVGLGQEGGTIELQAEGIAIIECTNPGGNEPPGQQPAPVELTSGVIPFDAEDVTRSGQFTFDLTTLEPSEEFVESQCARPHFEATLLDVQFDEFTIVLTQAGQTTTLGPFQV